MSELHSPFDPSLEPFGLPGGHAAPGRDTVAGHLVGCVSAAGERLKDELGALAQSLDDACERCVARTRDCAESTRETVRAQPLRAVAAALAVGLLIGRLMR